jgi:hypothetical protein
MIPEKKPKLKDEMVEIVEMKCLECGQEVSVKANGFEMRCWGISVLPQGLFPNCQIYC